MKTLVVDDNKLIRVLLSKLLEDYGSIEVAKSGEQGVELFRASFASPDGPFSLVCMDMSMGAGMSGSEALAELRKAEAELRPKAPRRVKMLVVTSFADRESVMKTKDLCDGYLLKPVAKEKLYEKMELFGFKPLERKPQTAAPQPEEPKRPEKPKGPEAAQDAEALDKAADFSSWDSSPLIAMRAGALVVMLPKKESKDSLAVYEPAPPASVKAFESVKPNALAARLESDDVEISCGEGLAYLPKKRAIVARKGGRVVLEGGRLNLEETLSIDGPLRPGKIEFAGNLAIKGDVMTGASISAGGSVKVEGSVGACAIECGGDFEGTRVSGQGSGSIASKGSIKAAYVYSCKLKAGGGIAVEKECISSELKTKGSIKGGAFIGGSCLALKSIEIAKAGSPKETSTVLRAGFDFEVEERIAAAKARLAKIDAEIESVQQMLGPYSKDFEKALELPERQKARILELVGKKVELKYGERPGIQEELDNASALAKPFPLAKISVAETLHKGVRLEIGEKSESFPQDAQGPLAITAVSDDARYLIER